MALILHPFLYFFKSRNASPYIIGADINFGTFAFITIAAGEAKPSVWRSVKNLVVFVGMILTKLAFVLLNAFTAGENRSRQRYFSDSLCACVEERAVSVAIVLHLVLNVVLTFSAIQAQSSFLIGTAYSPAP